MHLEMMYESYLYTIGYFLILGQPVRARVYKYFGFVVFSNLVDHHC